MAENNCEDLIKRNLAISYATSGLVRRIDGEDWIRISEVKQSLNDVPTIEITEEQAIDKLHETGWLPEHDKQMTERPKGNWIKWNFKTFGPMGDWEYKCDRCEKVYGGEYNFCPNCGADMQKGGTPNG